MTRAPPSPFSWIATSGGEAMSPDAVDREIADHCRAFQATCQLRFIARALSGGILDDRCQQEGCQ